MTKRNKIIYWIATLWLALGMTATGIVQILQIKEEVDMMNDLGYPLYFLPLLGIWKLLGVIAILIPKFGLLKEWAYAGFAFDFLFAAISHGAVDGINGQTFFPLVLLGVLAVSYIYHHKLIENS